MTRSSSGPRLDYDLEIKITLLVVRKSHKHSQKVTIPTEQMANLHDWTLKELGALDMANQPLCKDYLELDAPFEL